LFKLKKVELLGFKSFADRTHLEFGDGTAAIIGPNGCGKSNVADAINWVLGEQSPRSLRGDRMADVIFSGTHLRPATSMTEVSLTLVDPEAMETPERSSASGNGNGLGSAQETASSNGNGSSRLTDPRGEIVVTRRLFRSGESEYLMNGDICRLRDIQDLFMGTGLGPDSYAIIEQGRIGQILSSRPSDRRAILEEAAGVSKFRTRKRLAEAKLESSRQNLSRVTDILEEVSKQVNSLKRQASKARRHRELTEALGGQLKVVLSSRLLILEGQCTKIRGDLAVLRQATLAAAQELEALETREKTAAERYEQLEAELAQLRESCAQTDLDRERLAARLQQIRDQVSALDRRRTEAGAERAELDREISSFEGKAAERALETEGVRREASQAEDAVRHLLVRQTELASALREAESRLEAGRHGLLADVSRAAELRNQLAQGGEMAAALDRQAVRAESEHSAAAEEYEATSQELDSLRREHAQAEEALAGISSAAQEAAARLDQARGEQAAGRAQAEALRDELAQAQARREALGESLARHAYSTESVRRLLSGTIAGNGSFRPIGVLADFVEVTPGYEEVVEEFLRRELDCVVVERHQDARHGLDLLETEGSGRSTFFVTRFASNGHANRAAAPDSQPPGVVARLADLVRFQPSLGLNGDLPLASLAHAYMVEDGAAAERLAGEYPAHHFLTPRGEHYHHRLVSGGKGPSAGPLALRRDFRELERRVTELEPALEATRGRLAGIGSEVTSLEEEVQRLAAARVEAEKNALRLGERLRQSEQVLGRSRQRLEVIESELGAARQETEALRRRRAENERELTAALEEQSLREAEIAEAGELARALRAESDRVAQELAQAQVRSGALQERLQAAEAERAGIEARLGEMKSRHSRLELQCAAWLEEQAALGEEGKDVSARLGALEAAQAVARNSLVRLAEESRQARDQRTALSPAVEAVRARLEEEREKRSAGEVALARAESDLGHHITQSREELGREPAEIAGELPAEAMLSGEALEAAGSEVREIRKRITSLGPINMMALEELQEAEERLIFLDSQRQDLLASIEDTAQAIREIDEVSRRQFLEAFEAINRNFAETFRTLFGGGVGAMRLCDESDADTGIDLVAQPPGKRLQNVLLLSGGEKALVALALLIAIFRYTPSPFCVLDEVDAPLDDSNVERFTRMIREMSRHTQFILMTHNKRTMEICPVMYGVTMEQPGVSKLVSVRFETREMEAVAAAV
jgi:chromosome segregation protein